MFYVTARDGERTAFLLGPFKSNEEAEQWVDAGRRLACDKSAAAWFYLFGTARVLDTDAEGVLNHLVPLCEACGEWAVRNGLCFDCSSTS